MRFRAWTVLVLAGLAVAGCSKAPESGDTAQPEEPTESGPAAIETQPGAVGAQLDLPAGWRAEEYDHRTDYWNDKEQHFSLWAFPEGTSEDDAVAAAATTVVGVVKEFAADSTDDAKVGDAPAHHLVGTGVEADDGDDSKAEIYVFTSVGRVRLACVHGEGDAAEKLRPTALEILATMKPE